MKVIVIDGVDCVGKETQCELLKDSLEDKGYKVKLISFPNYMIKTGLDIGRYLSGKIELDVYGASTLYANNRKETLDNISLNEYDYVILDRYTSANIIHQSVKLNTEEDVKNYINWLLNLEYNELTLPYPDLTIILDLDTEISNKLLLERGNKCGVENDIHEEDLEYRSKLREHLLNVSDYLGYEVVKCDDGLSGLRSKEDIHEEILSKITGDTGKRKKVVFDIDDTLNNLNSNINARNRLMDNLDRMTAYNFEYSDLTKDEIEVFYKCYREPIYYSSCKSVVNLEEFNRLLQHQKSDVVFYTRCLEENTLEAKYEWVKDKFSVGNIKRISIEDYNKKPLKDKASFVYALNSKIPLETADVIVEDCLDNLLVYPDSTVKCLIKQPWNVKEVESLSSTPPNFYIFETINECLDYIISTL